MWKQPNRTIEQETDYSNAIPTVKEIVLLHIKKISDICCQELTEGRWIQKPFKTAGGTVMVKEYLPDLREAYCNAVDFLVDLVCPYADTTFNALITTEDAKKLSNRDEKLTSRRSIFRQMNQMFWRTKFFDNESGRTLRSG